MTRLKIAVLTPMARPRISTAAVVKRQSRASRRTACRVSRASASSDRRPARVAARFLDLLDATEQAQCLEPRVVLATGRSPAAVGLALEMELQLFVQIGFAAAAKDERAEPAADDVPDAHGYVLCSTRLTPADRRSHFATSVSSCLRPALVSE